MAHTDISFSPTETEMGGSAVLTPDDLPGLLKRQVVLKPEFTLHIYDGSAREPHAGGGGSQTPVEKPATQPFVLPVPSSAADHQAITKLMGAVQDLTKTVADQQDHIAVLGRMAIAQQDQIRALEAAARATNKDDGAAAAPAQMVDCGIWKKAEGRLWGSSHEEAYIPFGKKFAATPKVSVALNHLDVGNERFARLKTYVTDVDAGGFVLHADLWGDTRIYGCGVSWIAVGVAA